MPQLQATARLCAWLCAWLCAAQEIDPQTIATHRDWSKQTSCPGRDLYRYVAKGDLRRWVEAILRGDEPGVALLPPLDAVRWSSCRRVA